MNFLNIIQQKKTCLFDEVNAGVSKMEDVDRCEGGVEPYFKNKQTNKQTSQKPSNS